jgi:uncharacterized Fe-S center protein
LREAGIEVILIVLFVTVAKTNYGHSLGLSWEALMASEVYISRSNHGDDSESLARKALAVFEAAGLADCVREKDFVALKGHFGERGGTTYIKPPTYRALTERIRSAGGLPFLTDTTTLYLGMRSNGIDYAALAAEHGFTVEATGAPFIIADGVRGDNEVEVPVDGKHYNRVFLASEIMRANSMIVVSHVTGHIAIGMGARAASRRDFSTRSLSPT